MNIGETFQASGKFFDGDSAKSFPVTLQISFSGVKISGDDVNEFWDMNQIRDLDDQARDVGIVLENLSNLTARLIIPDAAAAKFLRAQPNVLKKRQISNKMKRRLVIWGAGAVASVWLIMAVILPAMANSLAKYIPLEREVALGEFSLRQIQWFVGGDDEKDITCKGEQGLIALDKMVARLNGHIENPYDLKVQVFRSDMINAFAVPGGQVVLFNGLLKAADTPEEVAGVLGHEIGHVINRDPTRLSLRTAGSAGILSMVFGDFAGGFAALALAESLISASYAQEAETNADVVSHEIFAKAGLPASRFATFFSGLRETVGDEGGLMSHIASHPDLKGREQAALDADVIGDSAFEPVLTSLEWAALKRICVDG